MLCPNCKTRDTLKAKRGNVPVSRDEVKCTDCHHELTYMELIRLEENLAKERIHGKRT